MDKFRQIQENLFEYFENTDDATFVEFVDSFAYFQPTKSTKVSKLVEQFIKDNDLFTALANEKYDKDHPEKLFNRSSLSDTDLLSEIRIALISLSHNRFRFALNKKDNNDVNKKNFDFLKSHLLECYNALNRSESYFDGEVEDSEFVQKVGELTYKKS